MISDQVHSIDENEELLLDETLELDLLRAARAIAEGGEWPVDEHCISEIQTGIQSLKSDGFICTVQTAGVLSIAGITPAGRRFLDDLESDS